MSGFQNPWGKGGKYWPGWDVNPWARNESAPVAGIDPNKKEESSLPGLYFLVAENQSEEEKRSILSQLEQWINQGLGVGVSVSINPMSGISNLIEETDNFEGHTEPEKTLHWVLKEIDKSGKKVKIKVVNNDERVLIGNFRTSTIDVNDLRMVENLKIQTDLQSSSENRVITVQGKLGHELYEQFLKQVKRYNYDQAHEDAVTKVEDKIQGSERGRNIEPLRLGDGRTFFLRGLFKMNNQQYIIKYLIQNTPENYKKRIISQDGQLLQVIQEPTF
ncbi:MAG: hypothetical protein H6581_00450 [Bacteroidia bacterium]|nr:hypothetical protein [Bacteroidia bacterium]